MQFNKNTELSKFLSYILRHEPQSIGLTLDNEGWANIGDLIKCANQSGKMISLELIQQVVENSDKKRLTISADGLSIRAAQGHSTESVSITYAEKIPPALLYHGTATRFLESIKQQGLLAGKRQHVHLSEDMQTAKAVGQRYGKPVVLTINALQMYLRWNNRGQTTINSHFSTPFQLITQIIQQYKQNLHAVNRHHASTYGGSDAIARFGCLARH